jgi:hypothetical protein
VIVDISHILRESRARLNLMSHLEIEHMWGRMQGITTRFLTAVNYRGNPTLLLFPRYPQSSSSSALTACSYQAPSSSSRPLFLRRRLCRALRWEDASSRATRSQSSSTTTTRTCCNTSMTSTTSITSRCSFLVQWCYSFVR